MPTITDHSVGRIGFGLMGLTWTPTPPSYADCFRVMRAALANGANFWNAGEMYGPPDANSLQLLNAYFTEYPEDAEKVVLSIKGGADATGTMDGTENGVRNSVENCVRLLDGKKKIDVFECARVDQQVPIEDTMRALLKLKEEGKIEGIGLSEVRAETVRRAAAVAPIAAVEVELSLTSRDVLTNGVGSACQELGIPIAAYSPLCRGLLTGKVRSAAELPEGDLRKPLPRFQEGVLENNLRLADAVVKLAERKGCTAAQVAIAWVISQSTPSAPVIPIPGASSVDRVTENMHEVTLDADDKEQIAEILYKYPIEGDRYGGHLATLSDG